MDISTVREIASSARPNLDSYRNCGAINAQIYEALQDNDIECDYVEGRLTRYELRGEGPEHAFIVVTDSRVTNSSPIIVDGAIQQFSRERREAGEVFFSLGSKEDIPLVAVLNSNDSLYEKYLY